MSRQIDLTRPPTEEEIKYLSTRAGGNDLLKVAERKFGDLSEEEAEELRGQSDVDDADEADRRAEAERLAQEEEDDSFDEEDVAQVAPLTVKELKERLTKVGVKFTKDDNKEELQVLLLEYLEAERLGIPHQDTDTTEEGENDTESE